MLTFCLPSFSFFIGPGPFVKWSCNTPSSLRFSWNLKRVPWTDRKALQDDYCGAVKVWRNFHDILDDKKSNMLGKKLRGSILKWQCYVRSNDLVKAVPHDKINSVDGATYVVTAIHKRDLLSFVTDVYSDFNMLVKTYRGTN